MVNIRIGSAYGPPGYTFYSERYNQMVVVGKCYELEITSGRYMLLAPTLEEIVKDLLMRL